MSFRLRALTLLMLVAVLASGATAWLTLRQATRQVQESVTADRQQVEQITRRLRDYGLTHGTWDGVGSLVGELAGATGQRIRLVSDAGEVLADSDDLSGRPPRQVAGPAVVVDPRPVAQLPSAPVARQSQFVVDLFDRYRTGLPYAACLTRTGVGVRLTRDASGLPTYTAVDAARAAACTSSVDAGRSKADTVALATQTRRCMQQPAGQAAGTCLVRAFAQRIGSVAAAPARAYLGAINERAPSLAVGPSLSLTAVVAVAVIAGALALSRGVLKPVRALTAASAGLGAGHLQQRVPVSGRDEIAALGRSFNRMADSLQASEERQRQLVADVAHELRTPLANVRGYLEALQDGVVEPTPALLGSLHEEVLLQQRIIEDLHDLALAEAGALTYHWTQVPVNDLLLTCRAAQLARAEAAGVTVQAEGSESTGPMIWGDPDRLRQVLANLISNALRATPTGGSVQLSSGEDAAGVWIDVRDSGGGISAEDLPHLFDRFWRADPARGRHTGGSGLGLAIARQIITDHRGHIGVRSDVGSGTTFTVRLPRSTSDGIDRTAD